MNKKPNPELIDDENPEWTDEMFKRAKRTIDVDPNLVELSKRARGRPKLDNPKISTTIRLSSEVIEYFRSTGKGWQTKVDEVLSEYVSKQ